MLYAGVDGAPERFGLTRMNALGPRLGIAYQLDSKTVIRAGGSIFYQPSREDGNADNGIQGFGGTFGSIGNSLSNGISYLVKDGFTSFAPQIAALRQPISSVLNNPVVVAAGFGLPFPSYPQNLQLQQALRPFPQYAGVDSNAGGQNDGHMTFHALETSFEHRFNRGLYVLASYTFCKLISGSNGEDANRTSDGAVQNQYNRRADKAVASQDTPHNLRISYVYELPFGQGKRFLGNSNPILTGVLGNWKISAIQTYVSGTPLVINCNQNFFGAGANARCSFAPGATTGQIPLLNPAWTEVN